MDRGVECVCLCVVKTWTNVEYRMAAVLNCAATPRARSAADVMRVTDLNQIDELAPVSNYRFYFHIHEKLVMKSRRANCRFVFFLVFVLFLRAKAECFVRLCHRLGVRLSVRPSVRPSHS